MSLVNPMLLSKIKVYSRAICSSSVLNTKQWRTERGLPVNRNAEGVLTDTPDFTYLDGRPSPILHKQKQRIQRQREYAARIVELCSELDFAKERYQKLEVAKEEERQRVISDRLKPKGNALLQKKK